MREPDPRLEEIERSAARGQRGAGHDHGGNRIEEVLAEGRADLDRGRGQRDPPPRAMERLLDPIDGARQTLAAPLFQSFRQCVKAAGSGAEVLTLGRFLELLAVPADRAGQLGQGLAHRVLDNLRLAHPAVAARLRGEPLADIGEEAFGTVAALQDLPLRIAQPVLDQEAAVVAVVVQAAERIVDLPAGDAQAQVIARHGLHGVRLVEDEHVVIGQDARALHAKGQVAEQQGVVHNQDLGVLPPPGLIVKAVLVTRAGSAHAIALVAGHLVPDLGHGLVVEGGQRAVGGLFGPRIDLAELIELLVPAEQSAGSFQRVLQPSPADVVPPPFDQHGGELERDNAPQERDVLAKELFLKADRMRGNDHAASRGFFLAGASRRRLRGLITAGIGRVGARGFFIAGTGVRVAWAVFTAGTGRVGARAVFTAGRRGGQDGRHEVGKTLADARPRLDDQVVTVLNRPLDRLGHRQLLGPVLIVFQPSGDSSGGAQNFGG